MRIQEIIRESLLEKGASIVGFADLGELPEETREGRRYGISIGIALDPWIVKQIAGGPTIEYYGEYQRVNQLLANLADEAVRFLNQAGFAAISKAPTVLVDDPKNRSTALPHKTVATRAGMGWIGKCALLVTPEYGSALRITTVLTNASLETGQPVNQSQCGPCSICVDACPGQAPSGADWEVGKHRDDFFNAARCAEAASKSSARINVNNTICGICIAVCPWTIRYLQRCCHE